MALKTPEELFREHENLAKNILITQEKELQLAAILDEYSGILQQKIEESKATAEEFYTAEIRGFTLRLVKKPDDSGEKTVNIARLYFGPASGIGPIVPIFSLESENGHIARWLDQSCRKYLFEFGWHVGILHVRLNKTKAGSEEVIVYAKRQKAW